MFPSESIFPRPPGDDAPPGAVAHTPTDQVAGALCRMDFISTVGVRTTNAIAPRAIGQPENLHPSLHHEP
ncbi:MAG TPA: hypothetical protein VG734_14715 [Lacunisphaera sp.]|nr:hypothetical protein [Lacunisphaera sp.]